MIQRGSVFFSNRWNRVGLFPGHLFLVSMIRESICRFILLHLAFHLFTMSGVVGSSYAQAAPPTPLVEEGNSALDNEDAAAPPEIFYMRDDEGNPVPTLSDRLSASQKVFSRQQEEAEGETQLPAFALTSLRASGRIVEERADLLLILSVQIRETGWIRIPLGMREGLLREEIEFDEAEDHFVEFDEEEGFIAWIKSPTDQDYHITLPLTVAIEQQGDNSILQLDLPRTTTSALELEVPGPEVTAQVSERASLQEITNLDDGYVKLSVLGVAGAFEMSWRPQRPPVNAEEIALEIASRTLVVVQNQNKIRSEIELTVRPYGGPVESIVIQTLKEARLIPSDEADYTLSVIEEEPDASADEARQRILVQFANPIDTMTQVQLTTETTSPNAPVASLLEAGNFHVENSVRASGHIAIAVEGDWNVSWAIDNQNGTLRQVDVLPESLQRPNVVAGFEHYQQPFSLPLRIYQKQTRIRITPTYSFHIEEDQIAWEAHLAYEVRGAKAYFLTMDLDAGWQIDSIGPEWLVKQDSIVPEITGPLVIGLNQAKSGEFEIVLKASRALPVDTNALELSLPQPRADVIEPALVVVDAAEHIRLTVEPSDLRGWTRDVLPDEYEGLLLGKNPRVYRVRGEDASPQIHADIVRLEQEVAVHSSSEIELAEEGYTVQHDLTYHILHKPLEQIRLDVSRKDWEAGNLEFSIEGKKVEPTLIDEAISEEETPSISSDRVALQIAIIPPRTGLVVISARSTHLPLSQTDTFPQEIEVELLTPNDHTVTKREMHISASEEWKVSMNHPAWQAKLSDDTEKGHRFETAEQVDTFSFSIDRDKGRAAQPLMIQREWIQTWIAGSFRQDRAVYQLSCEGKPLQIRLPGKIITDTLVVLVDGNRISPLVIDDLLEIPMDSAPFDLQRIVEITYRMQSEQNRNSITFQLPVILGAVDARRTLWQLILPENKRGQLRSSDWASEQRWGWQGWRYGALPTWTQSDLEAWSGGSQQTPPPAGSKVFIFSHIGKTEQVEMFLFNRIWLFLGIAGSLLIGSLLFLYVKLLRRIEVGLFMAAALLSVGLIYPELALMAVQWAGWGILFSLLALTLRWIISRKIIASGVIQGTIRPNLDSPSSQLRRLPGEGSSQSSTKTSPMLAPLPGAGAKR